MCIHTREYTQKETQLSSLKNQTWHFYFGNDTWLTNEIRIFDRINEITWDFTIFAQILLYVYKLKFNGYSNTKYI